MNRVNWDGLPLDTAAEDLPPNLRESISNDLDEWSWYNGSMHTVTCSVRDFDPSTRQVFEHVLGTTLGDDKQVVISVQDEQQGQAVFAAPPWLKADLEMSFREVHRITTDLFGDDLQVRQDYDPDAPSDKYVVFDVTCAAGSALRLEGEWVKRVRAISSQWPAFSLSLNVVK